MRRFYKYFVCVFILPILIFVNTLHVNADEVLKYKDYSLNDASGFFTVSKENTLMGETQLSGSGAADLDFSSLDLDYLSSIDDYVITLSGSVSAYVMYSGCTSISDNSQVYLSVNGSSSFPVVVASGKDTFSISFSSTGKIETLQLHYMVDSVVSSSFGGYIDVMVDFFFEDLTMTIQHYEDDTVNSNVLAIIQQPKDDYVDVGEYAVFSVVAQGQDLTYQWQYKNASYINSGWNNSGMSGAKSPTLSIEGTEVRNGQLYRCIITDASGNQIISKEARIYINDYTVETLPDYNEPDATSPVTGNFVGLMTLVINLMQMEFAFGGYSFSYWQIMILICLSGVVCVFIRGLFS